MLAVALGIVLGFIVRGITLVARVPSLAHEIGKGIVINFHRVGGFLLASRHGGLSACAVGHS